MLVKLLTALALLFAARANAIPLDPRDFESIGALRGSTGTLTIDTDGDVPILQFNLEGFKGVVVPQGRGLPDVAVFAFDDIAVTGSVSIRGSGSRPVALLSKRGVVITPTIDLSGGTGDAGVGGSAGIWGGAPLRAGAGAGSNGSGGGFGGAGGETKTKGGRAYGDLAIGLRGGSGGGTINSTTAGGGAGAIEIGAIGSVSVRTIIANGGAGAVTLMGAGSERASGGGSGGAILLHGTTVSAVSLQARGGAAANVNTAAGRGGGGGGGGGRILVAIDTYSLGDPAPAGDADGGRGGTFGTVSGEDGEDGVFDLRAPLTVVGAGKVFTPGADGRMPLPGGAFLRTKDMILRAGGAAVASHPYATTGLLTLESGSAFTAVSTMRIDHLVRIASGSGLTAIGLTEARAAVVLDGGTYSALGGLLTNSRLEGHGAIIGPVQGTAGSALLASGGTLTVGDANRSDGMDWQGTMTVRSAAGTPATLQLNSAGQIALGGTLLDGPDARLATLNGARLVDGKTVVANDASRISGKFRNDGRVSGPTDDAVFLTFDDLVSGVGSYAGNVRFAGGFSPGASPALVSAGTVFLDKTNTLRMELGGRSRGTEYDALDATGTITLGGALEVVLIALEGKTFAPVAGDTFDLLRGAHIDGSFSAQVLPTIGAGLEWHTGVFADADGQVFRLSVAAVPEPRTIVLLTAGLAMVAGLARRRALSATVTRCAR